MIQECSSVTANVFSAPFNRPNLVYSIKKKPANGDAMNKEIAGLLKSKYAGMTGIIYVFSRKEAQEMSDWLRLGCTFMFIVNNHNFFKLQTSNH